MPEKNNVTLIIDTKNLKIQIHISFAESMIWDWNPKIFPFVAFWSTIFGFASGRGRRDLEAENKYNDTGTIFSSFHFQSKKFICFFLSIWDITMIWDCNPLLFFYKEHWRREL